MDNSTYSGIRQYREHQMSQVSHDHIKLNLLHDEIMNLVVNLSIYQVTDRCGPPPSSFSFFVMGSAGRLEQSIWSDQDHGIIYQVQSDEANKFFLALGKEISTGLHEAGYEFCDGGVMASNPLWCKSLTEWQQQLFDWASESSWESIRYLLIFIDGRSVYGEQLYVEQLKRFVYQTIDKEHLLIRILNNTMYLKKGISVLGQILAETHGPHSGALNVKEIAILPFVNAVRLLAIKEKIIETSTLARFDRLSDKWISFDNIEFYKQQFLKLLNDRLLFGNHADYENGHYIPIDKLQKEQKKEMKDLIRNGTALFRLVKKVVERDDLVGKE